MESEGHGRSIYDKSTALGFFCKGNNYTSHSEKKNAHFTYTVMAM